MDMQDMDMPLYSLHCSLDGTWTSLFPACSASHLPPFSLCTLSRLGFGSHTTPHLFCCHLGLFSTCTPTFTSLHWDSLLTSSFHSGTCLACLLLPALPNSCLCTLLPAGSRILYSSRLLSSPSLFSPHYVCNASPPTSLSFLLLSLFGFRSSANRTSLLFLPPACTTISFLVHTYFFYCTPLPPHFSLITFWVSPLTAGVCTPCLLCTCYLGQDLHLPAACLLEKVSLGWMNRAFWVLDTSTACLHSLQTGLPAFCLGGGPPTT